MGAERSGPAKFDRIHCSARDASEMAVTGLPILFAVAAEDVRHLRSRRHGKANSAWRQNLQRLTRTTIESRPVERAFRASDEAIETFV